MDFAQMIPDTKRILITGGTGFVGTWLQKLLPCVALNEMQYEYGKWDYADWDYIVHLVPPPITTERVIKCAQRCKASVLFSSSGAVYDRKPGEYAQSKIEEEKRLLDSGVNVRIARMFSFAGAFMPNRFALINYILDALSGEVIKIRGDNVVRSYLYAEDMAIWLWRILFFGEPETIYEVGSEHGVTMYQLAVEIAKYFSPKPEIVYDRIYGLDPRPYYVPDTSKTREALQLNELTSFQETIAKTIQWYRENI
jgi:nucleoside-diphosphate-sugar epimerase